MYYVMDDGVKMITACGMRQYLRLSNGNIYLKEEYICSTSICNKDSGASSNGSGYSAASSSHST